MKILPRHFDDSLAYYNRTPRVGIHVHHDSSFVGYQDQLISRSTEGSARFDLTAAEDFTVPAKCRRLVSIGLRMVLPTGLYGKIEARSGLALKHWIQTGAEVIESDYQGVVGVLLFNFSKTPYSGKADDRIAQMIFMKHEKAVLLLADIDSEHKEALYDPNAYDATISRKIFTIIISIYPLFYILII